MIKIGITGQIAAGKSLVADIVKSQKIPVIDADDIAREVIEPEQVAYFKIIEAFGERILDDDQKIDRKKMAEIVFNDPEKLEQLNAAIQPSIYMGIGNALAYLEMQEVPLVFLEIPLLYEMGYQTLLDQVWVVTDDPADQLARLMQRDQLSEEQALHRIESQMSQEQKVEYADVVIDNSQSKDQTKETVIKLLSEISYA